MNIILAALIIFGWAICTSAETVLLKDGTKLESINIVEEGENLAIQTKYGRLAINKAEVENLTALGYALDASPRGPKTTGLEFISDTLPDETIKIEYFSNKEKIAGQMYTQDGELLRQEGAILDGTYREFYSDGKIKKEKTIIDGKNNGSFKTYYPDGILQSEAYFINGKMNGGYRIFSNSGKLLIERNFIDGVLNGYVRDFDENGALKSQILYVKGEMSLAKEKVQETAVMPKKADPLPVPGLISEKRNLVFLEPEVYSVGGADREWKKNFDVALNALAGTFDYANGRITTYPGVGATFGVSFTQYRKSPIYIAANYTKGPSADIDVSISDSFYGTGSYSEEIKTSYYRFVLGSRMIAPISERAYFLLDANIGHGGGRAESESITYVTGIGRSIDSDEVSWTGLTWSIGPGFAWEYPTYIFELGVRYTAFPDLIDNDTYSDIKWRPFSFRMSFMF